MKKLIALLLLISSLLCIVSCKKEKEYQPVESTDEEATTVMILTIDGDQYAVRYELYRALFLNYKSTVDGGNPDVWSGENKENYVREIDEIIIDRITEIYSAFAVCKRIGFDLYSDEVEDKIRENIRISVEGGSYGSSTIQGYDSYEDYLAALKTANLNYSVQVLLFRYAIAIDAIDTYYIGTADSDDVDINLTVGKIEYTREDVKSFYDSDDCVRVLRASFQSLISYTPKEDADKLSQRLKEAAESEEALEDKEQAVFAAIMSSGRFSSVSEVRSGYVIGKYNLERSYYGEMTDAAFSLDIGEVSDGIHIVTDAEDSYYVLYRTDKTDAHFDENYESIKYVYLMNYVGKILHDAALELEQSVKYSEFLLEIDHSAIAMK